MNGGRWGSYPEAGPLNPVNAVGATGYAPIVRLPCERGTADALNLNPGNVQGLTTAVGYEPGWTPYAPAMKGGKRRNTGRKSRKGKKRAQRGGVQVGEVDSMRYYAPTAGYDNRPMMPQVHNNPGILMQVGYPARHFNEACMKTN